MKLTSKPCIMCGMALVHSRVARVFIRERRETGGALSAPYGIQSRKGLNHHYKVYQWKEANGEAGKNNSL
jgi:tRNA-specific adenosine deaminase 3